jgi:hypothetical protein
VRFWRNYILIGAASMVAGLLAAFAVAVVLDPFGRLGFHKSDTIGFKEERPSMVSRAIDPRFDSAIIGNSTSMPLMPQNLDRLTGQRFVSLSISGSDAPASLATMKFFLAHHPDAKIVLVALLSETWCGPTFSEHRTFPFWLYSSLSDYFSGLAKNTSIELFRTTLANLVRMRTPGNKPYIGIDGYHTYGGPFEQPSYNDIEFVRSRLDRGSKPEQSPNPGNQFPAIQRLAEAIARPSPTFYVLVWTPRYINYTPAPGSAADQTDRACKADLKQLMTSYPNVAIIDWSEADRPENNDPANFFDPIHYRRKLADRIEESVRDAIRTLSKGS